jgi:subtilase family serine protease
VVDGHRGTPDTSMSAAVDGGVDVFFSFTNFGRTPPVPGPQWHIFGGTSEARPLFAGVVALANQMAGHRLGFLNPHLYELGDEDNSGIVDITKGNNSFTFCVSSCGTPQEVDTTVVGFPATKGFDLASGWGTINAARFVPALAGKGEDDGR